MGGGRAWARAGDSISRAGAATSPFRRRERQQHPHPHSPRRVLRACRLHCYYKTLLAAVARRCGRSCLRGMLMVRRRNSRRLLGPLNVESCVGWASRDAMPSLVVRSRAPGTAGGVAQSRRSAVTAAAAGGASAAASSGSGVTADLVLVHQPTGTRIHVFGVEHNKQQRDTGEWGAGRPLAAPPSSVSCVRPSLSRQCQQRRVV